MIAEVAVSVLLVVTGGQVLAAFVRLIDTDPGFQADRVLASVVLPAPERYPSPEKRAVFYRRMVEAVRGIPGVQSAGTVDALPFSGENHGGPVSGGAIPFAQPLTAEIDITGGDYLEAMGIRLLEGRWFREEEMSAAGDAAIVSASLAGRLWPGKSGIGHHICVFCTPEHPRNWKRVIGVVSGTRHAALEEPGDGNSVYLAAGAMQYASFLVLRTERPPTQMGFAVRRAIAAIDPNQPVFLSATMRQLISDSVADRRFVMLLLAITACLALALSAAGVYGVISYTTSRRSQEIGIRMAIGATPGQIFGLIFRQGFWTVTAGVAIGLVAALVSVRYLRSEFTGLERASAGPVWVAAVIVTATAAIACWMPARRATRIDPVTALREE